MRTVNRGLHYSFRLYLLNADGKRVLGKGGAQILEAIDRLGSVLAASKELEMSHTFVRRYIHRMENRLGEKVVARKTSKGTALTPLARKLLRDYRDATERLRKHLP